MSAAALPAARPPIDDPPWTDAGSLATVITDSLSVRDFAGSRYDELGQLGLGTRVFVSMGPLSNEGLDWYEVMFTGIAGDPPPFGDFGSGWVAAGPTGETATALSIDVPRCPGSVTASSIGFMSSLARLQCLGTGSYEVTGVVNGCTDYSPPDEPAWLWLECLNLLTEDGSATELYLHFPPELGPGLPDQDATVRVVGHVDDPRASDCRDGVSAEPPIPTALANAWGVLYCRSAFVVTELEITG